MDSLSLFPEEDEEAAIEAAHIAARKVATTSDVEAAGGIKTVAIALWPDRLKKDKGNPNGVISRLSNACNTKQKQELTEEERFKVAQLAVKATTFSHILAFYAKELRAEVRFISKQEKAQRAALKLSDAAKVLKAAMREAQDALGDIE